MSKPHNLILARLAAERARLLRELIGIDRQTLETVPVFADWTAANLLAHIGDYDLLFVERFQKALQGQEIASISDDSTPDDPLKKRNAELHARIKDWSLERSLEYFSDARTQFLDVLAQVSDKDLKRTRQVSWGETSLFEWTRWRWRHDAGHAEDFRRWRKTLQHDDVPGAKSLLLAALAAARRDFIASAALVHASERKTRHVCGTWTLKDVYGHMADWDVYFYSKACAILGSEYHELNWHPDWRVSNEKLVQARRTQSWQQIIPDFNNAFRNLLTTLKTADEETITRPYNGSKSPYPTLYHCAWSALEHYLDHAAVIRKELPVRVPKRLWVFAGPYT